MAKDPWTDDKNIDKAGRSGDPVVDALKDLFDKK
jgi:hypothetical protein